jgi:hypothetical protein
VRRSVRAPFRVHVVPCVRRSVCAAFRVCRAVPCVCVCAVLYPKLGVTPNRDPEPGTLNLEPCTPNPEPVTLNLTLNLTLNWAIGHQNGFEDILQRNFNRAATLKMI